MKYYTVNDLAEQFRVHPETIKREVSRNNLEYFKVGTELRFSQEHVDRYTNVKRFGKTVRELELEQEVLNLNKLLRQQEQFIELIKNELIKLS